MENSIVSNMKKIVMISKTAWMYIFMMFFGLFLGSVSGYADTGSRTFYYALEASSTPTGYGKVYATTSSNAPSESDYKATDAKNGEAEGFHVGNTNYPPEVTFNFYALANDGYAFSYWRARGTTASVSTNNPFTVTKEITSTSNTANGRTPVKYQAVFVKVNGLVKVKSADISRGSATINNVDNGIGDEVRLTALPVEGKGIVLLGWKKEGSDAWITDGNGYHLEDNSLIFTVTSDNQGTYVAYFSDEAEQSYYRIRNKATGKMLCLIGDQSSKVTAHMATIEGESRQDGYVFTDCLALVDDNAAAQCNPGTVFKFTGVYNNGNLIGTTLSAQGVSLSSLAGNRTFTIEPYNGNYRIYTTFKIPISNSVSATVKSYLCGVATPTMMSTYSSGIGNDEWELFSLTENNTSEAFGANAQQKYTQDGKYYTSMYAPFPYKLLDGVKAYYLPLAEGVYHESTNTIVFSEIKSGIVPANTPVILECKNYNGPSSNRLLPLIDDVEIPVLANANLNFLKGYLDLNGNKVKNDHDKMYVFSIYENKLGFYHYNNANMNPHKAYLLLPMSLSEFEEQYKEKANNAKFAFKFEEPAMIELNNVVVDDADAPVFDLQGRKVKAVKAGVYVKKGKKYVVK